MKVADQNLNFLFMHGGMHGISNYLDGSNTESKRETSHCSSCEIVISTFFLLPCVGTSYHRTSSPDTMMRMGEK